MKETASERGFVALNHLFVALMLIVVLYPLIYIVSASISDPAFVKTGQMWLWPMGLTMEGYELVLKNADIWLGYRNTIFYTLAGTAINLIVTLPCAYALSRPFIKGRGIVMAMIVFTMLFNGGLIPTFLLVKSLGMVNTVWAMLLPSAAAAWNIIVSRTFFQMNVPRELEEAAEMDGCSPIRIFIRIVVPLSMPIIAVMGLFYGVSHWNQFFNALIYLSDHQLFPLQLFLREILVESQMNSTMDSGSILEAAEQARIAEIIKYAVMIVSMLPLLIAYPFLQRFFLKGVMIGSLKG